jgi:hypothetical protein
MLERFARIFRNLQAGRAASVMKHRASAALVANAPAS